MADDASRKLGASLGECFTTSSEKTLVAGLLFDATDGGDAGKPNSRLSVTAEATVEVLAFLSEKCVWDLINFP